LEEFNNLLQERGIDKTKYIYTIISNPNPITEENPAVVKIKNKYLSENINNYTEKEIKIYE